MTQLFITEHMRAAGIDDARMADEVGIHRITMLRMRHRPERLRVEQLEAIAEALGMADWRELTLAP